MLDGIGIARSRRAAILLALTCLGAAPPTWFRCRAVGGGATWTVSRPADGQVTVRRGDRLIGRYALGRADPGAGNVYYALRKGGREVGYLRAINGGMLEPPRPGLVWSSIRLGATEVRCRR